MILSVHTSQTIALKWRYTPKVFALQIPVEIKHSITLILKNATVSLIKLLYNEEYRL
jgi:hypothetical protein